MTIREDFLTTARIALELLRHQQVAQHWDRPSALPEFGVSGLAGHLAYQALPLPSMIGTPPGDEPVVSLMEHYERAQWTDLDVDSEFHTRIRAGGEKLAVEGRDALCDRFEQTLDELAKSLPGQENRGVRMPHWGPWAVPLDEYLVSRLMEFVVHSDDLAVSVGLDTPEFPRHVSETVIDLLTRMALNKHRAIDVVRALSRKERAPQDITAF
ncbi:Mycothiol maleylpyruvate isomerase N-terminal domain-containing protein [Lentzea albidocapillata subsp. violacea]|uniref:Mycothiol maleylpyruvate isomerase N-terminal domain-containing protein n=1 Tax=Lentzea albidocapillata subsp. violacea TaxID=128104 RepID=A0A1G8ZRK5_9PSEU|nr:maleylpyruvate isomerase N-terminal domain-containing protein [Lentzea albidocapillata]SDK16780.1 Mycothiol maleylpyruvate isomerase N-terminal domain-containing protein [Lentzea albidocapillata subsp. violacea]